MNPIFITLFLLTVPMPLIIIFTFISYIKNNKTLNEN